jgi:hypothetical protein
MAKPLKIQNEIDNKLSNINRDPSDLEAERVIASKQSGRKKKGAAKIAFTEFPTLRFFNSGNKIGFEVKFVSSKRTFTSPWFANREAADQYMQTEDFVYFNNLIQKLPKGASLDMSGVN